jgi:hypothetical protein
MTEEPSIEPTPEGASEEPPMVVAVSAPPLESRPRKSSLAITRLIQAIWLGSGVFLMLSASAAFSAATNPTDAANVVGAILTRWHYLALLAPLLLMFLEWRRSRPVMLVVLFVAILLASFQALLDTRIRMIRAESFTPISSLPHDDPVRRQFGMLHGISQLFLVGQVIAAAAAVATRE